MALDTPDETTPDLPRPNQLSPEQIEKLKGLSADSSRSILFKGTGYTLEAPFGEPSSELPFIFTITPQSLGPTTEAFHFNAILYANGKVEFEGAGNIRSLIEFLDGCTVC